MLICSVAISTSRSAQSRLTVFLGSRESYGGASRRIDPAPATGSVGERFHRSRMRVIDGTILTLPDAPAALTRYRKHRGKHGGTGFPQARLVALVDCGTNTLIDVAFGPTKTGETNDTPALTRSVGPDMTVLADRNFAAQHLLAHIAETGPEFPVRLKNGRKLQMLECHPDGSAAGSYAHTPAKASSWKPTRSSSPTNCCAPRWPMPPTL